MAAGVQHRGVHEGDACGVGHVGWSVGGGPHRMGGLSAPCYPGPRHVWVTFVLFFSLFELRSGHFCSQLILVAAECVLLIMTSLSGPAVSFVYALHAFLCA